MIIKSNKIQGKKNYLSFTPRLMHKFIGKATMVNAFFLILVFCVLLAVIFLKLITFNNPNYTSVGICV